MVSGIVGPVIIGREVGMPASTHTLDPDPALAWRLVGIPKAHRQAPAVVGDMEAVPDRVQAPDERAVFPSRQAWIRPSFGDAMEFALLAVTLAAIGWLHFELLALLW
jgi:hypothetical protein